MPKAETTGLKVEQWPIERLVPRPIGIKVEWRDIPLREGYMVNSLGEVWSKDRQIEKVTSFGKKSVVNLKGKKLQQYKCNAYLYCQLGRGVRYGVHRLVCMAFHGMPENEKLEAAHLDGNAHNNVPDNLVWVTHAENEQMKKKHGTYYMGRGPQPMYVKLFERFLNQMPRLLIWVKNGFVLKQNGYHNGYEIIFYGFKPGGGNKWYSERTEDCASDVWKIKRDTTQGYVHPTQKPVEIAERAIKNSSDKDALVYDAFGGSGSTLIACEKTGRVCRMMELSPHYCDVIVKRWQDFTGQKATLESNGKTFDEVANG